MNFQELGPYELLYLARFLALPALALGALVLWIWRIHARQRELARRVALLEAGHIRR